MMWYHWKCYFEKYSEDESLKTWKGFDTLEKEDQEDVLKKCSKGKEAVGMTKLLILSLVEPIDKKKANESVKEYLTSGSVEYATSSRSACKWCSKNIERDDLRSEWTAFFFFV